MKKIMILVAFTLLLLPLVLALTIDSGVRFIPTLSNATYVTPTDGITCDNIIIGKYCVNITGGTYAGDYCEIPTEATNYTLCDENDDCGIGDACYSNLCSVYIAPTAPAGGGGGGGSCPPNMKEFHGYCTDEGLIQGFVFDQLSTKICFENKVYIKLRVIDDEDDYKVVTKVYLQIDNETYDFTNSNDYYILNEKITLPGNVSSVKFIAVDTINSIDYEIEYDYMLKQEDCTQPFLELSSLGEIGNKIQNFTSVFDGFSDMTTEERINLIKDNSWTILLISISIIIMIILYRGAKK